MAIVLTRRHCAGAREWLPAVEPGETHYLSYGNAGGAGCEHAEHDQHGAEGVDDGGTDSATGQGPHVDADETGLFSLGQPLGYRDAHRETRSRHHGGQ